MLPQLGSVLNGWTKPSQMRVVTQSAVDFELKETVDAVEWFEVLLTPMTARKVDRKPENLRTWKWWEAYTTANMKVDTVVQDPDGLQFRVQDKNDWSEAGFFRYDIVQQPPQPPAQPAGEEATS
jgi:hypothetical protein